MLYEIENVDRSRRYTLRDNILALEVGQSFLFPLERINYVRSRAATEGKRLDRGFTVSKANCSITRIR